MRLKPISLKDAPKSTGTVHFHPYEHTETPIPSVEDGINWVYHSYWEIADEHNPIFFIVFKDKYASWAMFPKPPIVRKKDIVKTGIFPLGEKDKEFKVFS